MEGLEHRRPAPRRPPVVRQHRRPPTPELQPGDGHVPAPDRVRRHAGHASGAPFRADVPLARPIGGPGRQQHRLLHRHLRRRVHLGEPCGLLRSTRAAHHPHPRPDGGAHAGRAPGATGHPEQLQHSRLQSLHCAEQPLGGAPVDIGPDGRAARHPGRRGRHAADQPLPDTRRGRRALLLHPERDERAGRDERHPAAQRGTAVDLLPREQPDGALSTRRDRPGRGIPVPSGHHGHQPDDPVLVRGRIVARFADVPAQGQGGERAAGPPHGGQRPHADGPRPEGVDHDGPAELLLRRGRPRRHDAVELAGPGGPRFVVTLGADPGRAALDVHPLPGDRDRAHGAPAAAGAPTPVGDPEPEPRRHLRPPRRDHPL